MGRLIGFDLDETISNQGTISSEVLSINLQEVIHARVHTILNIAILGERRQGHNW